MKDCLEYSKEGLLNVDIFFDNAINFYVEDSGKEYRYQTILEELFDVKIETVFALGCKNNLKQKFRQLEQESNLNNSFFIADLDFDYILKKDLINNEHFIYLEKYEIENYILEEKALIKFLKNQLCCLNSIAEKKLNYSVWFKEISEKLYELFILYLIVQYKSLNIDNTNQNANIYFDEEGNVNIKKIDEYYKQVDNLLKERGYNMNEMIKKMKKLVLEEYSNDFSKIIKGKYILIGIRKYLSNIIKKETNKKQNVNDKHLEDFLYDFFDKKSLSFIKEKVISCI